MAAFPARDILQNQDHFATPEYRARTAPLVDVIRPQEGSGRYRNFRGCYHHSLCYSWLTAKRREGVHETCKASDLG